MELLSKVYDPKEVEPRWYTFWLEQKYFHAQIDEKKQPFTIVIPPPNVTGSLHMGHALNNTLQDIIMRKKRMEGYAALWLPGTDHAGIATQNVVEKQLAAEGLTRQDLGRDKFVERVWQWKEKYGNTIVNQLQRLGCSCDWDRERFTMDEGYSKAVKTVFVRLYEDGLIYKGYRIINWCPRCLTALSDIEVEHEDEEGHLWHIKYPFKDSNEYLTIATTRPETLLGDTAVAVHPDDPRYKKYLGKILVLPCVGREIPVIADEHVDPKFGTGAVKVTPAHDPNDFEIGKRHQLEQVNIFTSDAKINQNGGEYIGMDRYGCREAIVMDLEEADLIEKIEPHLHAVGHCYRCHTVVEPYLSEQWFVKMEPLAEPAIKVVEEDKVKFVPKRWENVYFDWMKNIKDWCISRQIWWGHQIPAWYCECGEIMVAMDEPEKCSKCGSSTLKQDTDVLDTWFSSALWPFATLGWPDPTADLAYFYPTSILSTARDIIYLWVARMIMSGLKFCNDIPYNTVIIHPTVMTIEGKRMSKSLGTGVDPLELIEKYGTDGTRFGLTIQTQSQDMRFSEEKLEMSRNFANKIWNASRFLLMNLEGYEKLENPDYSLADRWILSRLNRTVEKVNRALNWYDFSAASRLLYEFFWAEFCDWYVELSKPRLYQKDVSDNGDSKPAQQIQCSEKPIGRLTVQNILVNVLDCFLRILHPFMPFITEEIWQKLPMAGESIMIAAWPKSHKVLIDDNVELDMELLQKITVNLRTIRAELKIAPSATIEAILRIPGQEERKMVEDHVDYIKDLAGVANLTCGKDISRPKNSALAVESGVEIFVSLEGLVDVEREKERLIKEIDSLSADKKKVKANLSKREFLKKAPREVIDKEKAKLNRFLQEEERLRNQLDQLDF